MLKKVLLSLLLVLSINNAKAQTIVKLEETEIDPNKIYFFAHSMCSSCKDAYVYLHTYHKDLNIPITNMSEKHSLDLYKQCVKKFNIPNYELRLPLICMKDDYIMGWDKKSEELFQKALENYLKN
jgi:hypothetical protein